jgi:hypothetical protein
MGRETEPYQHRDMVNSPTKKPSSKASSRKDSLAEEHSPHIQYLGLQQFNPYNNLLST